MKSSARERKSWFALPKVQLPSGWWRTQASTPTPTPTPVADEETVEITAPEIEYVNVEEVDDAAPEYMNAFPNGVDELLPTSRAEEDVATPDATALSNVVTTTASSTAESASLRDVPNISFSFFPDSDLIFTSTRSGTAKDSLERAAEQQSASSNHGAGETYENIHEDSTPRMAGGCLESVEKIINLDTRSEICDGSSYENFKELQQSSSSSDYQSLVDQSVCEFGAVAKTYESEYSIFIGKSVEIADADADVDVAAESARVDDVQAASGTVKVVDAIENDVSCAPHAGEDTGAPADLFYTQFKPRLSQLYSNLANQQPQDSPTQNGGARDSKSVGKTTPKKVAKSLTDLTSHSRDAAVFKSYKLSIKSESSSPKLAPRTAPLKLSEKFDPTRQGPSVPSKEKSPSPRRSRSRPSGPPPLPPVDWTDTPISAPSSPAPGDDDNYEDVEEFAYCAQRARSRRTRSARPRSPGLVRVRSRLGRVARAVSGWWSEERVRIGEVVQKHARAQAVGAMTDARADDAKDADEDAVDGVATPSEVANGEDVAESVDGSEMSATTGVSVGVKRRPGKKGRPASRSGLIRSRYFPEGQNGFEELRRFIKQGGDFCKDLSSILQERSEAESQYAKSLSKLSGKLLKASKDSVGTVNQAWQRAGTEMEEQSEVHRAFACALSEEVVKPLRTMADSQHRLRKTVEAAVDKTGKALAEWRGAETKSKKQSFMSARENEKLQDAMLDVRLSRAGSTHTLHHAHSQKIVSDKESAKLESKRRKAEDAVKKADVEYYTFCIRAERARLEWETAVIRGSHCFQAIEEERLQNLKDIASCYLQHLQEMGPKMVECTERLSAPVSECAVSRDIQAVVSIKGTGQPVPEQLLPDFYAEHVTLAMNRERRRTALLKLLQLVRQDIERERRGKQGVENLARALHQTPTFGTEDSQQNVTEKLHHMRSMLTYLEAARYKVQSALAELDGRARGSHPLAAHIQVTRDRQGLQQSVLKVPPWVRKESIDRMAGDSPDWTDRGAADGNSVQPDSDFDEFSSQGSEKDYQSSILTYPVISECSESPSSCGTGNQCKALYEYSANLYDELNLNPGDIINIHDKQPDGWWLGELNGVVGIFPATYVEEMK